MRKNILIVDDSKLNRSILRAILEATYEVLEADSGAAALRLLASCKESRGCPELRRI